MNRRSLLALGILLGAPPLAGQTRSEPQILLSVFGGLAGGTDLWEVNRQPLLILGTENLPIPVYDTLRVSRNIRSGFIAGINATYFPAPQIGFLGEIALLGLGLADRCEMITEDIFNDPQRRNRQVCDDIQGRTGAASAVAFFAGALLRPTAGAVTPYARLQAGFTSRQTSLTELSGRFVNAATGQAVIRGVFLDQGGGGLDPAAAVGLGIMAHVSPGYQLRLEVRDHLVRVRDVTGPTSQANPGVPPVSARFVHSFALAVHLDIVLERRRGRRY